MSELHVEFDDQTGDDFLEIREVKETQEAYRFKQPVEKILYKDESYAIQGAVITVYREMGVGFLEAVYQECLECEFQMLGIPYKSQAELTIKYKGKALRQVYRPDFICHEKIVVELKAVKDITDEHRAQVFNYLKATGYRLGLLVNFGHYPRVTIDRIVI